MALYLLLPSDRLRTPLVFVLAALAFFLTWGGRARFLAHAEAKAMAACVETYYVVSPDYAREVCRQELTTARNGFTDSNSR